MQTDTTGTNETKIMCAVAKNVGTFLAGETLLGFSVGFIVVYAAVPEILAKKYRPIGLAWIETAICVPWVGVAVLLGNVFAVRATWRWTFYIAIIYAALGLIGTALFYFPPSRPQQGDSRTRWEQLKQLDYVALFLFTGSLSAFLLGISWAGSAGHEWNSVSVVLPLVLGFVGFVSSFAYDFTLRGSIGQHIMFPLPLMRRIRKLTMSLVVVFVSGLVYYSMAALLPQATGYIFTSDGIKVGVYLLPNGIGQLLPACVVPLFLPRTKHPKRYIMAAVGIQTIFTGLYAYAVDFHLRSWMAFQFFGQSCFSLLTLTLVLNSGLWVEADELGVTVGLLGTFRSMGGSVGSTIFGTILRTKAGDELPKRIAAVATAFGYAGDLGQLVNAVAEAGVGAPNALVALDLPSPLQEACLYAFKNTYVVAFRTVFFSTIPFGVIAFIAAFFIKDASEMMNKEVSTELERNVLKRHDRVKKAPL